MKTVILNLNGSPYENGKISGEYFKEICNKNIEKFSSILKHEEKVNKCSMLLLKLEKEYPKYYEEIRGKSEGLGLSLLDYFAILCPEINNTKVEHCTTIVKKKDNGNYIISHNEDDEYLQGNFCLAKVKIDDNNYFFTNDMFNMPFGNGFSWNSYGIFKAINYCHEEEYDINNIPRYFSQRHISEAKSIEDLINRCKEMPIASGYHVNAIDINKKIAVSIEVYKNSIDIEYIDKLYVHTNHFIHKEFINNQIPDEGSNSIFRLNKALELSKKCLPEINSIKNILKYRSKSDMFEESILQTEKDPCITMVNITYDTENKNDIDLEIYINNEKFILNYDKNLNK